jgi:predicted  nucleic acid-binding Zn-ribbon protein
MSDDPVLNALFRLEAGMTGFATLEKRVSDLHEGQASLQAGQAAIEDRLSSLERHQTNLRVAVMERMDRLEDNLTAIREDISVN